MGFEVELGKAKFYVVTRHAGECASRPEIYGSVEHLAICDSALLAEEDG